MQHVVECAMRNSPAWYSSTPRRIRALPDALHVVAVDQRVAEAVGSRVTPAKMVPTRNHDGI